MLGALTDNWELWRDAVLGTLTLFFASGALALVLGFVVGAMRVSPVPIARAVGTAYVNTIRNTPLTLVFFVFAVASKRLSLKEEGLMCLNCGFLNKCSC